MHGAAPPFMPGWPPLNSHELYQQNFQGIKPYTSATPSVPPLNLAKYTESQADRELPPGWPSNGFSAPNGLETQEIPFNGVKGYKNYQSQSSNPVPQHSTSQSHGQQLSSSHPSAESLHAKYGINGPFNAHSHVESNTGLKFHLHDNKLKNGFTSFAINSENKDLNLHLPSRLPNHLDLYQSKVPLLFPNESPTNSKEFETSLSGLHRNDTVLKSTPHSLSTLASTDVPSRSESSMISEQKDKHNPAHIASSHAMSYYGSAEHTLSTSSNSQSSTASSASNSAISQAPARGKDFHLRDYPTHSDSSRTSLASIQKANKIAADICAEAQSSMMKPADGSKLPSFSNISNIVGNDKRHHGYDPYDFQSEERRSVDSRSENNLRSAQRGPNSFLPLNYWSNFGTLTPNVSLEKRDDTLHRDTSVCAIEQSQSISLNAPGHKDKEEESEKRPMSIKEMVEKKRNEKHKRKQASSVEDPNINQLVDAKVQEILAAYKKKELQKNPVKPLSSASTSTAASSRSPHDNFPVHSDHAHRLDSLDPPNNPDNKGIVKPKSMDKYNPPGYKDMPHHPDNQGVYSPSSNNRPLHQDSYSLHSSGPKKMPNRHDNRDLQQVRSREIHVPNHQENRDLYQPTSQDFPHRPDNHGMLYQSSSGIPNHHDNFGVHPLSSSNTLHHQSNDAVLRPSSRDTPNHLDNIGIQHPSPREIPNHFGNLGFQHPSPRDSPNHPGNLGFQHPSPREIPNHLGNLGFQHQNSREIPKHADNHGLHHPNSRNAPHQNDSPEAQRPNSRNTSHQNDSPDAQRPNSRNTSHYPDNLGNLRPSSRDMPYHQDIHGVHPSNIPSNPVDHRGAYPPRYQHFYHQTDTQDIHMKSSGKQHSENQEGYRPTPWDLQQQIMHMRLNRKEMLGQSSSEMHLQGLQPHGEEKLSQQNDLADPLTKDKHVMALHKQVDQMRSNKKSHFDPHQKSGLDHHQLLSQHSNQQYHQQDQQSHKQDQQHKRQDQDNQRHDQQHLRQNQRNLRQDQQHQRHDQQHQRQDQQYHQQDQQYHLLLHEQVQNMRNMKKEGHSFHQSESYPGMVPPWFENSKEYSVGHQSREGVRMSGNFVKNGLNLSMKKDPYEFDITSDKMNYQHPKVQFSDFNKRNGFSSHHRFLQGHYKARMNMEFDKRYMNRAHDPSLMDKNPLAMGQHKKIGSKPYGYKSSLSLLKKSQKFHHGRSSLPIKKVGKLGRPLGRPPGKLSGKLKNKVTKDMFADNLIKNLGFPPLTKTDLISYTVPKMKLNFLNGHGLKRGNQGILPQSQVPVKSEVKIENIWDKMDNIGNKMKNIEVNTDDGTGKIKHSSEVITEAAKKTRNKLQRSRSVECSLNCTSNIGPIRRSKSVDDCQKLVDSENDIIKENMRPKPPEYGKIGGNDIDVDILTNQIKDLKKLVTGHLEDYSNNLETNTVVSVPKCGCLGPDYVFNEAVEGPYYTHLGAGRSVEAIRQILEKRTGIEGKAIRIEKVRYTGKEGKSSQGCPIAKWIIRRSSMEEKYLALIRHRPGHFCDTAWLMIGLVAWEGVPTKQADDMYSYLSDTLPQNGFETERRCGTNDRKTCACQGIDLKSRGASFSFGCSWSMYFNGCKFARSQVARKFKLKNQEEEPKLEEHLQKLATQIAPLYQQCAPQAHFNQSYFSEKSSHCRLGVDKPGPFSGVTACADFCAHAHKDIHNMNNGSTVVVTLTKHRGLSKPDDEQLHVLPLYVLEPTDENGSYDAQYDKIQSGALEVLHNYAMEARLRSQPLESCRKRRLNKKSPGKKGRPASMGRTSPWTGSTSSNQSTPKKLKQMKDMSYLHSQDSSQSFSSQAGSLDGTPIKQNFNPNCVTPIKQNFYPNGVYNRNPMPYGIYNGSAVPHHGHGSSPMANAVHNGNVLPGVGNGNQNAITVNHGTSVSDPANHRYTMSNAGNQGNFLPNAANNGNPMSDTANHGNQMSDTVNHGNPMSDAVNHGNQMSNANHENPKSSDGNFMFNAASHENPKAPTIGNKMSDAANQGNQMTKSDNHRTPMSYTFNHGNQLSNPVDHRNSMSNDVRHCNSMSYAVNHGNSITDIANNGNPMSDAASHGFLISNAVNYGNPMSDVASHGIPMSNDASSGNPISNAVNHGYPMPNVASSGNPISNSVSHGHPMPNIASRGNPISNAVDYGNPMLNAARHGHSISDAASHNSPMSYSGNHGNHISNDVNYGNPVTDPVNYGNPVSDSVNHGNPVSDPVNHGNLVSDPVNHGNPVSNSVNHGNPVSNDVNGGNPVSDPVNHGNTVSDPVNHGNPVSKALSHENPVSNSINQRNPVSDSDSHGYRLPISTSHGSPISGDVKHGIPMSSVDNQGNLMSSDAKYGNPMSNSVNHGNPVSGADSHGYRMPISTSHGTPISSDVKHGIQMSSVDNQGKLMSSDVKYGNPMSSDANHGNSRFFGVKKESPIPYMVDNGNQKPDPVKYGNPVLNDTNNGNSKPNDGNSVADNIHKGNRTPTMDGNKETVSNKESSSSNVCNDAPVLTNDQDSNRTMPRDPTKVKDFHPGFEGLYDKFWNYFERNGSFPPPAFMAQYARARQMLLQTEAASKPQEKLQQSVDINHTENSDNKNVPGQTSSNNAPYHLHGHGHAIDVKQTDAKEMHNTQQNSLHRNDLNSQPNAGEVNTQKQPGSEKQHNERFRTQDLGTTQHSENKFNFINNSLTVGTTNTSNGNTLIKPHYNNSQETEQISVPHEQTFQAAQVSNHVSIQPSVKSINSSQVGSLSQEGSSMESPQTSAIDLSSTTSNSESASQHHLHESTNQEPLFQSNQSRSFHEDLKQKQQLHEESHQRHQTYQGKSVISDQQGHLPHKGYSTAEQSHLSLLSEAVHNRTKDLETIESTSPLNLIRENKSVYNSFNGNTSEARSAIPKHNAANTVRNQFHTEKGNGVTEPHHQFQANLSKAPQYTDNVTGPFVGKKPLFTPYSFDHQTSAGTSEQSTTNAHSIHFPNSNIPHDSGRSEYLKFHANEQKRNHISWNMFNYSQKSASHTNSSAMINGQSPIKDEMVEDTIDHDVIKCEMEYNEEAFRDPNIGGVAVALCHGAVLFEVAKRELHATTGLRHPNRYQPTRISLVFYQHKNLNTERHGMYAYAKKLENMKLERIAKMQEQQGFVDMSEIENSFKGGKKRKLENSRDNEEEYDIMKTSAIHYKYMLECNAKREESLTTNSFMTNWVKPQPMVTGPFQKWV